MHQFLLLKKALLWPGALRFVEAWLVYIAGLAIVQLFSPDDQQIRSLELILYSAQYLGGTVYSSYRYVSGQWTYFRWAKIFPLLMLPTFVFYGYASVRNPELAVYTGLVAAYIAGLPTMGFIPRFYWILFAGLFSGAYTLSYVVILGPPRWPQAVFLILFVAGLFYMQFALMRVSEYMKQVNRRLGKQLGEARTTRNQLAKTAKELKLRNDRIASDLLVASRVQQAILPAASSLHVDRRLDVAARYLALDSVGGDFYDVARVDANRISLLIADVSGHGVASALVASMAQVIFSRLIAGESPGRTLSRLNGELHRYLGGQTKYVTAACCMIDLANGSLQYSLAGHPPPLLRRRSGTLENLEQESSLFLGIEPAFDYSTQSVSYETGDCLLLYTDGLTEASADGAYYGDNRMTEFLLRSPNQTADELLQSLVEDLAGFAGPATLADDVTLLAARWLP